MSRTEAQFQAIVRAIRKDLNPDQDEWDLVFTVRGSLVLQENNQERAQEYADYEREHQDL